MSFKTTCPSCHSVLKSAQPVPAGKTLRCPRCQHAFKARSIHDQDTVNVPALASDKLGRRPPPLPDDEEPYEGPRGNREPTRRQSGNLGVILAMVGGVAFAIGLISLIILPFSIADTAGQKLAININHAPPPLPNFPEEFKLEPKPVQQPPIAPAEDKVPRPPPKKVEADKAAKAGGGLGAYERVKLGAKLTDLEKMLGAPKRAGITDLPPLATKQEDEALTKAYRDARLNLLFEWRDGPRRLFVGFVSDSTGETAVFKAVSYSEGKQRRGQFEMDRSHAP